MMETMVNILDMANGTFRLKSRELLENSGKTLYRVSEDGDVAYSTLHRWIDDPENVKRIEGKVLFGFLLGLGMSINEINEMRLGDIFEYLPEEPVSAE